MDTPDSNHARGRSRKGERKLSAVQRAQIPEMFEQGLGVALIARSLGVSRQTIYTYMKEDPELDARCQDARAIPDDEVERSLFKVATREKRFVPICEACERRARREKGVKVGHAVCSECAEDIVVNQADADPRAIALYLTNRRPEAWRNRREVTVENVVQHDAVLVFVRAISEAVNRVVADVNAKRALAAAIESASADLERAQTVH